MSDWQTALRGRFAAIWVFAPSGVVTDQAQLQRGLDRLAEAGLPVILDETVSAQHQRFAGDDDLRAGAFARLIQLLQASSEPTLCLAVRGGYGLSRLLSKVDWVELHTSLMKSGSVLCGHSDLTIAQQAVWMAGLSPSSATASDAQQSSCLWHGPMLCADWGQSSSNDFAMQALVRCCEAGAGGAHDPALISWQGDYIQPSATGPKIPDVPTIDPSAASHDFMLDKRPIWGGNLTVLASLIGSAAMRVEDIPTNSLLFIEDVNEHPYRVERALTQLLHAGVFSKVRVLLAGQFTDWRASPWDHGYDFGAVWRWLADAAQLPVITGLPFGHVPDKCCLPIGDKFQLDIAACGDDYLFRLI